MLNIITNNFGLAIVIIGLIIFMFGLT
ncbi:MFS transporter, partial [Francisella tularensis subsp. holarctica]|nr:MFS transporter [Francisella tularensis subsp. holarctica]